ncbi:MAG: Na+/H+ antiporter NhaA [Planctomycetota bacterium]
MQPTRIPGATRRPIDQLLSPIQSFFKVGAAGGILLMACTVIALVWANSAWADSYHHLWHEVRFRIGTDGLYLEKTLGHWVNDGLMAVFFFVVGLEIKRELLVGELATLRKAAVPIVAAIGGIAAPALLFVALNAGEGGDLRGWAVPTATDIAFAIGILALLGSRVPIGLKVFLTALAIVDDIGAVLIIAVFYTSGIDVVALAISGGLLAVMVGFNRLHVRSPLAYFIVGALMWIAVLKSGVHATIAGVLAAFTVPARVRIDAADFTAFGRGVLDRFAAKGDDRADLMTNAERQRLVHGLEKGCEHIQPPLLRLEHALHPWSSFLVMPVFALANAGVHLQGDVLDALLSPVSLGVAVGLVAGKQIGVTLATWLAVRMGWGSLPENTTWRQIYGASWLAGIGFTMSMFIAGLGFGTGDTLEEAKMGILAGSLVAGTVGFLLLRSGAPTTPAASEGEGDAAGDPSPMREPG